MLSDIEPNSFGELIGRALASRPDSAALIDGPTRWSWTDLDTAVRRLAAALAGGGLQPGDRIALQAPTSAEFVTVYLGALRAGLVVVPVNPAYTLPELGYILEDCGARLLVTSSLAAVAAAARVLGEHPALDRIVVAARSGADGLTTVGELIEAGRVSLAEDEASTPAAQSGDHRAPESRWRERSGEDLAVLLYTSGTSGRPKGAMLTVRALLANLAQLAALQPAPLSAEDRIFLPLPLFHVFGLNAGLGLALYFGATVVLSARFEAADSLQTMQDERISVVVGAPLEFALWAGQPEVSTGFAQVRFALSGSAPLSPELVGRYAEFGVALFEGYGLTEAAPVVTLNLVPTGDGAAGRGGPGSRGWAEPKPGSVGRPLPGVEVRLLDGDAEPVEIGDLGQLEVRGENLFSGYWPDGTGGPRNDGWFATGDLAVADDDGDYYLVGRRTDLVLVNGFNVYPAEVEAVFAKLPGVREAAVLGEPVTGTSDAIVAYLVAEPGTLLDSDALLEQASAGLARFKLPRRIVEVDALPHTATGKVMKWRLRAAASGPRAEPS